MPEEIPYRRQVRTQPAAPMPLTRPEDYGAGLAQQVSEAAQQFDRNRLQNYQLDRRDTANAEWARYNHEAELAREDMARISRESQLDDTRPDRVQRMRELWQAKHDRLLEPITEDDVRDRARAQSEAWASDFFLKEGDWDAAQAVNRTVFDANAADTVHQNRFAQIDDYDEFSRELQLGVQRWAGYRLPPDKKRAGAEGFIQGAAISHLTGLEERDPARVIAEIDEGQKWNFVDPDKLRIIRNAAEVELRSRDVEERRIAGNAIAALKEEATTKLDQAEHGQPFDNDRLAEIATQLAAAGDTSFAERIAQASADNIFAKVYRQAPPRQREARQIELARNPHRTEAENRELNWLERNKASLDEGYNSDPVEFYIGAKDGPPELNWNDPWSIKRREQWARATGVRTPLTRAESNELAELWRSGRTQDQLEALTKAGAFSPEQTREIARQIDPNDTTLQFMVELPMSYRRLALDGRDAMAKDPKLVNFAELAKTDEDAVDRMKEMEKHLEEALYNPSDTQVAALLQLARRLTAGAMRGDRAEELTPERYWTGLNMALGGQRRREPDGTERWYGGLGRWGEHYFALPEGVSAPAFGAVVQQFAAAADGPVERDGKTRATLSRAHPVMVRPNVYQFFDEAGGVLKRPNGSVFEVPVRPR